MKKLFALSLVGMIIAACMAGCSQTTITPTPTSTATIPTETELRPAEFIVGSLIVTPKQVAAGQEAIVQLDVLNTGEETGIYMAVLNINDIESEVREVSITGGETATLIFVTIQETTGLYDIEISGKSVALTVVRPAEFTLDSFHSKPANNIIFGQQAMATAVISNTGETDGVYHAILEVDGVEAESRDVEIMAGETKEIDFPLMVYTLGYHEIALGDTSRELTISGFIMHHSNMYGYDFCYPEAWRKYVAGHSMGIVIKTRNDEKMELCVVDYSDETQQTDGLDILKTELEEVYDITLLSQGDIVEKNHTVEQVILFSTEKWKTEYTSKALLIAGVDEGIYVLGQVPTVKWENWEGVFDIALENFNYPESGFIAKITPELAGYAQLISYSDGYLISFPEDWEMVYISGYDTLLNIEEYDILFKLNYGENNGYVQIQQDEMKSWLTVREYFDSVIRIIESFYIDYDFISENERVVNDINVIEHTFSATEILDGERVYERIKQVYLVRGNTAYSIVFSANLSSWEEYEEHFENIISSFCFLWTEEPLVMEN